MKKLYYLIIFLFSFFILNINVFADSTCVDKEDDVHNFEYSSSEVIMPSYRFTSSVVNSLNAVLNINYNSFSNLNAYNQFYKSSTSYDYFSIQGFGIRNFTFSADKYYDFDFYYKLDLDSYNYLSKEKFESYDFNFNSTYSAYFSLIDIFYDDNFSNTCNYYDSSDCGYFKVTLRVYSLKNYPNAAVYFSINKNRNVTSYLDSFFYPKNRNTNLKAFPDIKFLAPKITVYDSLEATEKDCSVVPPTQSDSQILKESFLDNFTNIYGYVNSATDFNIDLSLSKSKTNNFNGISIEDVDISSITFVGRKNNNNNYYSYDNLSCSFNKIYSYSDNFLFNTKTFNLNGLSCVNDLSSYDRILFNINFNNSNNTYNLVINSHNSSIISYKYNSSQSYVVDSFPYNLTTKYFLSNNLYGNQASNFEYYVSNYVKACVYNSNCSNLDFLSNGNLKYIDRLDINTRILISYNLFVSNEDSFDVMFSPFSNMIVSNSSSDFFHYYDAGGNIINSEVKIDDVYTNINNNSNTLTNYFLIVKDYFNNLRLSINSFSDFVAQCFTSLDSSVQQLFLVIFIIIMLITIFKIFRK